MIEDFCLTFSDLVDALIPMSDRFFLALDHHPKDVSRFPESDILAFG